MSYEWNDDERARALCVPSGQFDEENASFLVRKTFPWLFTTKYRDITTYLTEMYKEDKDHITIKESPNISTINCEYESSDYYSDFESDIDNEYIDSLVNSQVEIQVESPMHSDYSENEYTEYNEYTEEHDGEINDKILDDSIYGKFCLYN